MSTIYSSVTYEFKWKRRQNKDRQLCHDMLSTLLFIVVLLFVVQINHICHVSASVSGVFIYMWHRLQRLLCYAHWSYGFAYMWIVCMCLFCIFLYLLNRWLKCLSCECSSCFHLIHSFFLWCAWFIFASYCQSECIFMRMRINVGAFAYNYAFKYTAPLQSLITTNVTKSFMILVFLLLFFIHCRIKSLNARNEHFKF